MLYFNAKPAMCNIKSTTILDTNILLDYYVFILSVAALGNRLCDFLI